MIPLFRSNYSLSSVLTLKAFTEKSSRLENRPDSIFDICKDYGQKDVFLVDNTLTGLVDAYENARSANLNLRFGYRVNVCNDMSDQTDSSIKTESKFILFAKGNTYSDLIHLHNISTTEGIHKGKPRLDYKTLKKHWSKNLLLAVPFYDSYLYYNLLHGRECVPELSFTDPFYFNENNGLPFDGLLGSHLESSVGDAEVVGAKTIYHRNYDDFKAYMTYRCILNRTTFQKPNLNHFGSREFCMESWAKATNNKKS